MKIEDIRVGECVLVFFCVNTFLPLLYLIIMNYELAASLFSKI